LVVLKIEAVEANTEASRAQVRGFRDLHLCFNLRGEEEEEEATAVEGLTVIMVN